MGVDNTLHINSVEGIINPPCHRTYLEVKGQDCAKTQIWILAELFHIKHFFPHSYELGRTTETFPCHFWFHMVTPAWY